MNVYLTGIMGCGKTSVGKALAQKTGRRFIDVDEEIEREAGVAIPEIFAKEGENGFRERESAALLDVSQAENAVVSTGGGIVLAEKNIEMMKKTGTVVWIKRDIGKIIKTADASARPLIRDDPKRLFDIYEKRKALYESSADICVMNDKSLEDTVLEVLNAFAES